MGILKDKKINQLIQSWPKDAILTSEWIIHKMGYTKSHLQKYSRSGWIKLIGKGAYVCTGIDNQGIPLKKKQKIEWQSGVYAMQALRLNQKATTPLVHIGGRSALELKGLAHFLSMSSKQSVSLFVQPTYRVPNWFKKNNWEANIHFFPSRLFSKPLPESFIEKDWGGFATLMSCPERAIMEVLYLCPKHESLDHAKLLMENLAGLRPKMVSTLLQYCTSVKVKRLFLALADICNHAWLSDVDVKNIDLGSGKRFIEAGQAFHPEYQISIPKTEEAKN